MMSDTKAQPTMTCKDCKSECQRFGKHRNGLRRFRCPRCKRTFTEAHTVFYVTDNAHLLALDRASGKLVWETRMAPDEPQHYGGTMAPLIVNDTVVAGVAGADEG